MKTATTSHTALGRLLNTRRISSFVTFTLFFFNKSPLRDVKYLQPCAEHTCIEHTRADARSTDG